MKALVFNEFGPADVLHVAEVEIPVPAADQVRIAVKAASVNPVDWKIRSGASRAFHSVTFPAITGMDAAGIVDSIGDEVTDLAVGDHVFGSTVGGATAEYTLLQHPTRKPVGMDWSLASALPSAVETAFRALAYVGIEKGDTVLINGVAGGVGLAAGQLAVARGARVLGTASSQRHRFLESLGIEPVSYGPGLTERVRKLTGQVDRVVDVAGNGILPELLDLVSGGTDRVITVADPAASDLGVFFTTGAEGRFWDSLNGAADLWSQGRFVMPIEHAFPLADGGQAHRISETGHVLGKIVITISL